MNIVEIYKLFPDQDACIKYLEKVRWENTPKCPYCNSTNPSKVPKERRYHCNNCNISYSVTVRTIFHKTKLDLQKWFLGITLILNAKKGVSVRQLARDLNINKNTAWYMRMRIRKAMLEERDLINGFVEIDETFIGGKPRKGTYDKPLKRGRDTKKVPVVGMAERGGNVRAQVQRKLDGKNLSRIIRENIDVENDTVITDEYRSYLGLHKFANHKVIEHQKWYVCRDIHTNTIESFWALLQRGIIGQYHKVSIRYLNQYINEFCYRHNNRNNENLFNITIQNTLGGFHGYN